jgi:hypothetical protein
MALMLSSLGNTGRGHMEYNLPLNGVIDLDALDEYLMSDHAPDDSMGLSGEVIASNWAGRFLDAVALRAQAWRPVFGDDRAGILLAPLFVLNGDLELEDGAADDDELLAEASDMIPTCIVGIHEFWQNYRKPPSSRGRSQSGGRMRPH